MDAKDDKVPKLIRLPRWMFDALTAEARAADMSLNQLIRAILRAALERQRRKGKT